MDFKYPFTKKEEEWATYHGKRVYDPYKWLENDSNHEVLDWARRQTEFSKKYIESISCKEGLKNRIGEFIDFDSRAAPVECSGSDRIFFPERKEGEDTYSLCMQENLGSQKIRLIDSNELSKDEILTFFSPSPKGQYLAYGKDKGGSENPDIFVIDVDSGKLVDGPIKGKKQGEVSWLSEESGFYYHKIPPNEELPEGEEDYWLSVYFHYLKSSEDKKAFYDDSVKEYDHDAKVSRDGKYVFFYRSLFGENEIYLKEISSGKTTKIFEGDNCKARVSIFEEKMFVFTNWNAPKGRILFSSVDSPEQEDWKEIVSESDDILESFSIVGGRIYTEYLHNSYSKIKIFSLEGTFLRELSLPGLGSADVKGDFWKNNVWVSFNSFEFPTRIYKYDFDKDELELFFRPALNLEPEKINVEQVKYESKDGTRVSMFILKKDDLNISRENPVLLYGYGGFGLSMIPRFVPSFISWIEKGGIVAIPNLRGGGEYGKEWHEAGKLDKKQNVFDDFISAAEYLINMGYTSSEKLSIAGGSNGGLLVGACMVQRPELFKAVCCDVPLLDMLKYHKFGYANIWAEEYGNSENKEQFDYLYSYSPYHNIKKEKYPAVLFSASKNDARVHPMHAFKMTAKLQEFNQSDKPILLLFREDEGHLIGSRVSKAVENISEEYAFLMEKVGLC